MEKMKDSGIEWIGEIPTNWTVVPFRAYVKERIERNKFNKTNELLALSFALGVTLYKDKIYNKDRVKDNFEEYNIVHKNDLVLSPNDIIKGSIFVSKYYGCISPMYYIFSARNNDTHNLHYLSYLLRTKEAGLRFFYIARGLIGSIQENGKYVTRRMAVARQDLLTFKVLLPPYETQMHIVNYLDLKCEKINSLKKNIEKQIEILEQYKKSIITETVTKGLNPNVQKKCSDSKWIPTVPEHWNMDKLKYNLTVHEIKGYGDKEVLSLYRELGIVPKNSRDDNHNVTSEDTSKYKYVRKGDFVINKMKAWQGSVAVSDFEGIVSPAYYVYEFTNDKYDKKYFHHLMRNKILADEFRRISGGIREGQWDLDRVQFENMYLPVPPKNEQVEIANFIESKYGYIEKVIEAKQQQLETLEEYKKSLIFEYVTGKKEV